MKPQNIFWSYLHTQRQEERTSMKSHQGGSREYLMRSIPFRPETAPRGSHSEFENTDFGQYLLLLTLAKAWVPHGLGELSESRP